MQALPLLQGARQLDVGRQPAGAADTTRAGRSARGCDARRAADFCPLCMCRNCPFCEHDGSVSAAKPKEQLGPDGACTPANEKDTDKAECQAFCSAENKGKHCELCKCKGCGWCDNFQPCSSGKKGDTKWVECQPDCQETPGGRALAAITGRALTGGGEEDV